MDKVLLNGKLLYQYSVEKLTEKHLNSKDTVSELNEEGIYMIEKLLTATIKNEEQPIHWHDLLEINFVLKGEIDVVRNNKTFHISTGEMMVINRDDIHSIKRAVNDTIYVQLHMNLALYNQYLPEIWTVLFYCSPEENDPIARNLKVEMKSHISNIIKLMNNQGNNVDVENQIVYYCIDILSSLKMGFAAVLEPSKISELKEEQISRVWKAIDYIYDNHNRKLTLHEVAGQVFVSDNYLSKILKQQCGKSFEEFLNFVRSEMSIRYLLNTEMSVTNIAYECGFSAPKYYSASFSKNYGCTPAEYRKNNKRNFMMEKRREAAVILYDEGVSGVEAWRLLEKYRIDFGGKRDKQETLTVNIAELNYDNSNESYPVVSHAVGGHGIRDYFIQRVMADVQIPYWTPSKNILIWEERDAVKIVLFNGGEQPELNCLLNITGFNSDCVYVYCRQKSPNIPESIKDRIATGIMADLDRDIIDSIYSVSCEQGEILMERRISMNISLKEGQVEKIILQRIKHDNNIAAKKKQ